MRIGSKPPKFQAKLHILYHLPTYFLIIVLLVIIGLHNRFSIPYQSAEFSISDHSIAYRHVPDIVAFTTVLVGLGIVPLLIVFALCFIWRCNFARIQQISKPLNNTAMNNQLNDPIQHAHLFCQAILFTGSVTVLITDLIKNWTGRLRPDFLDRCQPTGWNGVISLTSEILPFPILACTGDPDLVNGGRQSFPSGHSSFSFAGAVLIALWVFCIPLSPRRRFGYFSVFNTAGFRISVALIPIMAAAYVALSRIEQHVHHPFDVIFGSLLGTIVAIFFFIQIFVSPVLNDVVDASSHTSSCIDDTLIVEEHEVAASV